MAIGLLLAAAMSRVRIHGMTFFRTVLFLPQVLALIVVAVAWRSILAPDGLLNDILRAVGLGSLARPWLGDYTWALPAVGIVGTWVGTGLCMVLFLAGVQRIPRELYEAARMDGAGPVREFFAVTLPGLRPHIAVALTLTIDRGPAQLRPDLRHDQRRPRERHLRTRLRGVPPGLRDQPGRLGRRRRRGPHGPDPSR